MVECDGINKMKTQPNAMKEVYNKEEAKLQELVNLIKDPKSASDPVAVLTLGALIVLDVHSKDVTKELALA